MASVVRCVGALAALTVVGCGEDDFSDEAYGFIDLAPYFYDGSTAANPISGLPRDLQPVRGWNNGLRAEYYDFGLVGHVKKRSAAGATINEPDYAYVNPMYFFYDRNGNALFSKPLYDWRTGQWQMRGGKDVLSPNPLGPPKDGAKMDSYYKVPYSVRIRATVKDSKRGNADDYQRPIINALHNDTRYSGLWEVVEITVKDGGYEPDAVKSAATLQAGIDAGKFEERRTGKVIACPVLDDRTYVTPSVMSYNIPRPRVEVWYRTKLGTCYLIHGYETLASHPDDADPRDPSNIRLITTKDSPDTRVNTFDVIKYEIGDGDNRRTTVVVPVGKVFTPKVTIATMNPAKASTDLRYFGDDISTAVAKHTNADPPGYSPIVWHWDINVYQDPPYSAGSFKSLEKVDPALLRARDGGNPTWTRLYPVVGVALRCSTDADCAGPGGHLGLSCNQMPDITVATTDPPAGANVADMIILREGGPRCDVKSVGYGEYCAPGVARCETQTAGGGTNEKALKDAKVAVAGPVALSAWKDAADAKTALATAMTTNNMVQADPAKTDAEKMAAMAAVTTAQGKVTSTENRVKFYQDMGFTGDLGGYGYHCQPPTGGYCYIRCDGTASAGSAAAVSKKLPVPDPRNPKVAKMEPHSFALDNRCGGANLLGYRCLPGSGRADKQKVCMRECTTRDTDGHNKVACDYKINEVGEGGAASPFPLSDGAPNPDSHVGQQCLSSAGVTACMWNPDFEPRNPSVWSVQ